MRAAGTGPWGTNGDDNRSRCGAGARWSGGDDLEQVALDRERDRQRLVADVVEQHHDRVALEAQHLAVAPLVVAHPGADGERPVVAGLGRLRGGGAVRRPRLAVVARTAVVVV